MPDPAPKTTDAANEPPGPPAGAWDDIRDEIEDHLACSAARHAREGLDDAAARAQAVTEFGDPRQVAAELALIAQGDFAMNQKLVIGLVAVLALAVLGSAYFSYRSTAVVAYQVRALGEQMSKLAADRGAPAAAPPAPYGRILIRAMREGQPVANWKFEIKSSGKDQQEFTETLRTDADGRIDSGLLPLGQYLLSPAWPDSADQNVKWTKTWNGSVTLYRPGQEVQQTFNLPSRTEANLLVHAPANLTVLPNSFAGARVTISTRSEPGWPSISGYVRLEQPVSIPLPPPGQYSLRVEYYFRGESNWIPFESNSVTTPIDIPPAGELIELRLELPGKHLTGRVHRGSKGIAGVRIATAGVDRQTRIAKKGSEKLIAETDDTGRFALLDIFGPDRFGQKAGFVTFELPGPHDGVFMLTAMKAGDASAEWDINLDQLAFLTIQAPDLATNISADLSLKSIEFTIRLVRPREATSWSLGQGAPLARGGYERGPMEVFAHLVADDKGRLLPARVALPSDNRKITMFARPEFEVMTDHGVQKYHVDVQFDAPELPAGAATELVLRREQLFSAIKATRPDIFQQITAASSQKSDGSDGD